MGLKTKSTLGLLAVFGLFLVGILVIVDRVVRNDKVHALYELTEAHAHHLASGWVKSTEGIKDRAYGQIGLLTKGLNLPTTTRGAMELKGVPFTPPFDSLISLALVDQHGKGLLGSFFNARLEGKIKWSQKEWSDLLKKTPIEGVSSQRTFVQLLERKEGNVFVFAFPILLAKGHPGVLFAATWAQDVLGGLGLLRSDQQSGMFVGDDGAILVKGDGGFAEKSFPVALGTDLNVARLPELIFGQRVFRGASQRLPQYGMHAISLIDQTEAMTGFRWMIYQMAAVGLGVLLFCFILAHWVTERWIRRLQTLKAAVQTLGEGQFQTQIETQGRDEISSVAETLNATHEKLHHRDQKTLEAQTKLIESGKEQAFEKMSERFAQEMATPLSEIAKSIERLLKEEWVRQKPKSHEELKRVQHEAQKCQVIATSFANFVRKSPIVLSPLEVSELVRKTVEQVEPYLMVSKVKVQLNFDGELPKILGNEEMLKETLLHLLLNSKEAMPKGGKISISLQRDEKWLKLEVKDTGRGVAPNHLPQIVEPFFTTKAPGTGPGLGLSLSQKVMTAHHGHLKIHSTFGKETIATMMLPIPSPQELESAEKLPPAEPSQSTSPLLLWAFSDPNIEQSLFAEALKHQPVMSIAQPRDSEQQPETKAAVGWNPAPQPPQPQRKSKVIPKIKAPVPIPQAAVSAGSKPKIEPKRALTVGEGEDFVSVGMGDDGFVSFQNALANVAGDEGLHRSTRPKQRTKESQEEEFRPVSELRRPRRKGAL